MAVYLLLRVDNEEEAKAFARDVLSNPESPVFSPSQENEVRMRLYGIWKAPTMFCECTTLKKRAFTRGKNYGWYVCTQCGKPSKVPAAGAGWWTVLGTNLLPEELRPPGQYNHKSWASPKVWNDLLPPQLCSTCHQSMDSPPCSRNPDTGESFHTVEGGIATKEDTEP